MHFQKIKNFQDKLCEWIAPGCDCSVYLDGEMIYRYYTGWADIENKIPMRGDELYFFWSASKVITCALGFKLLEEGKFAMFDPVFDFMPEFRDVTVRKNIDGREEFVKPSEPIRIGHLFNMTSGFGYDFDSPYLREVKERTNGRCPTREVAAAIAKYPLYFEPGSHWKYGFSHDLLGAFIEVVSGKKLRDYAKEVLFDPLEMNETSYNLPESEELKKRFAVQYSYNYEEKRKVRTRTTCSHILGPDYDSGGAGVVSTHEDYAKFAVTMANFGTSPKNGYRFLSPASINLMRTNTLTPEQIKNDFAMNMSHTWGYGYGYGVRTFMDPVRAGTLGSMGEFGWDGAAGSYVLIDPDKRLSVVFTKHLLNGQGGYVQRRLKDMIYSELD